MKFAHGILISSCLALCACGGGVEVNDVDARGGGADAPVVVGPCMIDAALGDIIPAQNPAAFSRGGTPEVPDLIEIRGPFNQLGFETDWFTIRLWRGGGYFPTAIQPGTFELVGPAETDYSACSACVTLVGDHSGDTAEETTNTYMATSGTLMVSSVSPTFTATLSNATFRHVVLDAAGNQSPSASGCTASVDSLSVSVNPIRLLWSDPGAMPEPDWPWYDRAMKMLEHP